MPGVSHWLWMSASVRGAMVVQRRGDGYVYAEGGRPRDMLETTGASSLVSARIVERLTECGATGWKARPVEVTGRDGEPVPGYHRLQVTGRCGPLDERALPRRWSPPPVTGGQEAYVWVGFAFDPASWDGSDVFRPEGTRLTFVTEKVGRALNRGRLLNVHAVPFDEVERLSVVVDGVMRSAPLRRARG